MQNERNALKAGIFMLVSLALIVAVVIAIKGVGRFLEPTQDGTIVFNLNDDIGGLSTGDEVRIGGAKVGAVHKVEFAQSEGKPVVEVSFSVPKRFELHKNAEVAIQTTVTGVSVLNISDLGSGELLAPGQVLVGHPGALTALLGAGPDLMGIIHDVRAVTMPKVNSAIDKVGDTVTIYKGTGESATALIKQVGGKIDPIVDKYNVVMDTGKTTLQNIGDVFGDTKADFRTTVANLRDATGTVKERLPGLFDKVDGMLAKVTTAVDDAGVALQDVKKVAANTRDISQTVRQVINNNRGKLESMIASLKITGDNLKNATAEVRRSPWRLLYKPGPGEMANLNLYDSARQFADGANQLSDAAASLRDALHDPDVDQAQVQKLIEKLDSTFANFGQVEQDLWKQVQP